MGKIRGPKELVCSHIVLLIGCSLTATKIYQQADIEIYSEKPV